MKEPLLSQIVLERAEEDYTQMAKQTHLFQEIHEGQQHNKRQQKRWNTSKQEETGM
jgi:DnaJ-domain-containing protein 1